MADNKKSPKTNHRNDKDQDDDLGMELVFLALAFVVLAFFLVRYYLKPHTPETQVPQNSSQSEP